MLIDSTNTKGGGAIHNSGTLYLDGVKLLNNSVSCSITSTCTSTYPIGGAILNLGTLRLTDSTLDGNIADRGSAIFNTATANCNLTILSSTISNNQNRSTATITNYSTLTIINSTFSGNSSSNPSSTAATGITNYKTLSMQSSTMANKGWIGAIMNTVGSTVKIQDNIFKAESGYVNCLLLGATLTSGGYNISNDDSCQLTAEGDRMNTDPQLGSFDYWGGLTKTIMLNPAPPP